MTNHENKSILGRNPLTSLVMAAMFCLLVGLVMILTAVGAIVGIPLMVIGMIVAVVAVVQYRKRSPGETETIDEVDRRSHA